MSRVLLLAYHFPPLGGPGTQRVTKLVQRLPRLGHLPVVITGPGTATSRWEPSDPGLGDEVDGDIEIHRIAGPVPPAAGRRERWLDRPAPFTNWWVEGAVQAAAAIDTPVDIIYAGMAPYETAFAAARIAASTGRPWVADLRDPWALDEMRVHLTRWHRARDLDRMRRVLRTAHAIVMNTPEAAAALREAFPELGLKLVRCIPNGYDPGDLLVPPAPKDAGTFRIVHTGSLHTELGEAHERTRRRRRLLAGDEGVDILARSHVCLMQALAQLRRARPDLGERIELHLAGVLTEADRRVADAPGVRLHGYLDHRASVALLRSADLLFLPMHDLPHGCRARIVPGKTYEYLGSGRPLLAAVPDGDARDLLAAAPTAHVVRPRDIAGMTDVIAAEADHVLRHGARSDARPPGVERYERGRLAQDFAEVLDQLAPRGATSPATRRGRLEIVR